MEKKNWFQQKKHLQESENRKKPLTGVRKKEAELKKYLESKKQATKTTVAKQAISAET